MRQDGPWLRHIHMHVQCVYFLAIYCSLMFYVFWVKKLGSCQCFHATDSCPCSQTAASEKKLLQLQQEVIPTAYTDCSIIKYCTWHFWAFATFVLKLHFHKMSIVNNTGQVSWAFMFLFFVPPFGTIGTISSLFPYRYSSTNGGNIP